MHFSGAMRPVRSVALLAVVALAACAPVSQTTRSAEDAIVSDVRLLARTAGTARVLLTLENDSSGQVGYNLCASTLERQIGDQWTAMPSDEVCTMELRTLDPARSVAYEKDLPSGLAPGEYRYVTSVESPLGAAQRIVVSDPFRVI